MAQSSRHKHGKTKNRFSSLLWLMLFCCVTAHVSPEVFYIIQEQLLCWGWWSVSMIKDNCGSTSRNDFRCLNIAASVSEGNLNHTESDVYDDMAIQCCMERDQVFCLLVWLFPKIKAPQNGWFIMENSLKWMVWVYHYFRKHSYMFICHIHISSVGSWTVHWLHMRWLVVSQWRLKNDLGIGRRNVLELLESHTTLIILVRVFNHCFSIHHNTVHLLLDDPMYVAHFQVTSPEVPGGTGQLFRVVPQELDPDDGCEMLWCWWW